MKFSCILLFSIITAQLSYAQNTVTDELERMRTDIPYRNPPVGIIIQTNLEHLAELHRLREPAYLRCLKALKANGLEPVSGEIFISGDNVVFISGNIVKVVNRDSYRTVLDNGSCIKERISDINTLIRSHFISAKKNKANQSAINASKEACRDVEGFSLD